LVSKNKSYNLRQWLALEDEEWAGSVKIIFKITPQNKRFQFNTQGLKIEEMHF
jgi:hypothetical protein